MARICMVAAVVLASIGLPSPGSAQWLPPPPTFSVDRADGQRPDPVGEDQGLNRPLRLIFKDIGGDLVHLGSWKSAAWIGGGGLAALAVHPLDDDLVSKPGGEWGSWSNFFDPGTYIGNGLVLFGAAATTYAFGTWTDRPRAAHVGRDVLRTLAVSQVVVQGLKLAVSRERPDGSDDNSFPSGHAASTFAAAVVFQRHLGKKWAIPTYAIATYVGFSRLHENRHYLSDVVMGVGLGVASGLSTTRHATSTWVMSPVVVPGGAAVMVSLAP
ncbi:MAG: phosphatase PAP2 family protein [Acidobacteriota bacterium]|nr:phosphatase PAP2 family protein [Acidobacteriota bacterium]